jgi:hypothetical protein
VASKGQPVRVETNTVPVSLKTGFKTFKSNLVTFRQIYKKKKVFDTFLLKMVVTPHAAPRLLVEKQLVDRRLFDLPERKGEREVLINSILTEITSSLFY